MVTVNRGEPMRRRKLPDGEKRTEKVPMVRCSPSEMLTIERAARLRGMAVAAFVGDCAVRTAEGRLRPARASRSTSSTTATPVDVESPGDLAHLVEPLQAVLQELFAVRRQLAGAMTNLNQLTAAVNSGTEATAEQIAATLAHVERQLVSYRDVEDLVSTTVRELA